VAILGPLLRWLLVPVGAVLVVAGVAVAARWAVTVADGQCPADSMVAGACVEPWHTGVVEASVYAAVVLAALGLVAVPTLIAPALKRTVAVLGFLLASTVVVAGYYLTGWADLLGPLAVTIVSAGLALAWVWIRRRPADES
jgi:hypothetical protein